MNPGGGGLPRRTTPPGPGPPPPPHPLPPPSGAAPARRGAGREGGGLRGRGGDNHRPRPPSPRLKAKRQLRWTNNFYSCMQIHVNTANFFHQVSQTLKTRMLYSVTGHSQNLVTSVLQQTQAAAGPLPLPPRETDHRNSKPKETE